MADKEPIALRSVLSVIDQLIHAETLKQLSEIKEYVAYLEPNQRTANLLAACVEQREMELKE